MSSRKRTSESTGLYIRNRVSLKNTKPRLKSRFMNPIIIRDWDKELSGATTCPRRLNRRGFPMAEKPTKINPRKIKRFPKSKWRKQRNFKASLY